MGGKNYLLLLFKKGISRLHKNCYRSVLFLSFGKATALCFIAAVE